MKAYFLFLLLMISGFCTAQNSSAETFQRLSEAAANYIPDTTPVPEDQLTREIRKLRSAKGGFNISEAVLFKIGEEKIRAAEKEQLENYFSSGDGKIQLDNAVIHIYRKYFTLQEIRKMTRFYKSSAGKKMSRDFPLIMLESLKAAETIGKNFSGKP